jgi:thymidylate synthase
MQCLSHLSFKMVGPNRLDLTAMYRSHYYGERALGNLVGLSQLLNFVARESGTEPGTLSCLSTHALIDNALGTIRDVRALLELTTSPA